MQSFGKLKLDKTTRNRVLCGQDFQAMCCMPSLDNVVLIDFCRMLNYFARTLGCMVDMPSAWAILWDTHGFSGLTVAH